MQEVIQKLSELVTLLEEKIAAIEVLNEQLVAKKLSQEEDDKKLIATANQLGARERIVKNIENIAEEKKNITDAIKRTNEKRIANVKKEKEIDDREKGIKSKEDDLATTQAIFKGKNKMFDEKVIQMDTERKLMKEKFLEELKRKL